MDQTVLNNKACTQSVASLHGVLNPIINSESKFESKYFCHGEHNHKVYVIVWQILL